MVFGENNDRGIRLDGVQPLVVDLGEGISVDDLWIHDENDRNKAGILTRLFDVPGLENGFPRPFGVFYKEERPTYEALLEDQLNRAVAEQGEGDLDALIAGHETWVIE
jgi:2-oxoglutarate ferredoxin oxidoreductase subunit beta